MTQREEGRGNNPLAHSPNRLKLAVFGLNVSGGCAMTTAEGTLKVEWQESVRITRAAEDAGFEAVIPVARWRGFGGKTNFNHRSFETLTWAAGLAAVTQRIAIFATVHVPTIHPVRAAKEAATVDHIANGRFGLNLVAGWNEDEMRMFGGSQREHDERYAFADEWTTVIKRLWAETEFDFTGRFFTIPRAYSEPKPVQRPYPLIMNAGNSPAGRDFSARQADLTFILGPDLSTLADTCAAVKRLARERYGREVAVFTQAYVVCRATEEEARKYYHYYIYEKGDWQAVRNLLDVLIPNSQSALGAQYEAMAANMIAGYGALPLVGTPAQVVMGMRELAEAGFDGLTLCWVNYDEGVRQYYYELRPLLIQAGLRVR